MRISFFCFCLLSAYFSCAQDSTLKYSASIQLAAASAQTPFWLQANQHGITPKDGIYASGRWSLYKVYNPNNPRTLQWSGGAEAITNYGKSGNVFVTDLYLAARLGPLELMAGQKKNVTGIMDTTLTSGSLSASGNARPFPRIQLAIPDFLPLGFTNDFVALKASYSDGLMGRSNIAYGSVRQVPATYFHQKSLYFRFGQKANHLNIYAGINHQVIWGGQNDINPLYPLKPLDEYWRMATGKTLYYNRIGNHFGTIDIGAEWKSKDWSFLFYRQSMYETGSLFKIPNFVDGLNGLRINRIKPLPAGSTYFVLKSVVLEVVGTQNQNNNSPLFGLSIFEKTDYFNHYIYAGGWSYDGRNMGTPLVPAQTDTDTSLPQRDTAFTNNNRLWAFHLAARATWLRMTLTFKGTYSMNYGTYITPFNIRKDQVSLFLGIEKNVNFVKGGTLTAALLSDIGYLYPNTTGIMIGFRKSGFLK